MGTRIPLNRAATHSHTMAEKLEMSMAELGLSVRTANCLEELGIFTVQRPAQLAAMLICRAFTIFA